MPVTFLKNVLENLVAWVYNVQETEYQTTVNQAKYIPKTHLKINAYVLN